MSDRPTPMTDRAKFCGSEVVAVAFARDLERKLAVAREALALIVGKNSMLRSYTADEAASDAKQALARIDEKGTP